MSRTNNPAARRAGAVAARAVLAVLLLAAALPLSAAGSREAAENTLTLYSGRGESLVEPLVEQFREETGITVNVRYGGTSELAVLLAEEGSRTPADLFWAQDAGALGALAQEGRLAELPARYHASALPIYRSSTGRWVAGSGRARVLAYSPDRLDESEYPDSVFDLTRERYRGRVSWAPTNGSFQAFVTAMRVAYGDEVTLQWLRDMAANDVQVYRNNTTQVEAIAAGEVDAALVNNYYLLRFLAQDPDYPVAQRFFADGDIGNMVNIAGIGITARVDADSPRRRNAERFIDFLLSESAQQYITDVIYEYPVTDGVERNPQLESLERLLESAPQVDLDSLSDLDGTLSLLREAGVL
ncbi:iron ABC transporter substrate-binding protein [Spirochaeta africana]|uniref:ABC-type Fe3+ transport system, periplasmic component n=1 Tax=Spirochaeta africana (strain ATCC 700263 / DSM 8902 / Z-7692) TaxID=889378 RepID=H9ULK3_SPIAZ|nr:iron ABC transporter substrate-binding protein [Spirochaeta africana]AFG38396.1 ABC-type Fe3+ transport system, periplasmic component [Spirochaeta africana DSM 8902]